MTKRIWILIIYAGCLFSSLAVTAAPSLDYRPKWKPGQEWEVEVRRITTSPEEFIPPDTFNPSEKIIIISRYRFLVEDIVDINDESYWCVLIRYVKAGGECGSGDYYRAYFRQTDSWLKRLVRFHGDDLEPKEISNFPYGPVLGTDLLSALPLEFPLFTEDGADYVHDKGKPKSVKKSQAAQACRRVGRSNGNSSEVLKIVLEENVLPYRRTTQLWEKNKPWWNEAILELDSRFWSVSKLISIDGKELPEITPHAWSAKIVDNKLGVETNIPLTVVDETSTNAVFEATGSTD